MEKAIRTDIRAQRRKSTVKMGNATVKNTYKVENGIKKRSKGDQSQGKIGLGVFHKQIVACKPQSHANCQWPNARNIPIAMAFLYFML